MPHRVSGGLSIKKFNLQPINSGISGTTVIPLQVKSMKG